MLYLGLVGAEAADIGRADHLDDILILVGQRLDDRHYLLDQRWNVDRLDEDIHLASLDLRQVEDVVDQSQQVPAGAFDLLQVFDRRLVVLVGGVLLQNFAVADDRVERRAQLVRHVGEEARFGLVGDFGGIARGGKFGLALLQFGDVCIGGHDATVRGFSFADLNPSAVAAVLDMRAAGSLMLGDSFRQPGLVASIGIVDFSAFDSGASDRFESRARLYDVGVSGKNIFVFAIKDDKLVVRII